MSKVARHILDVEPSFEARKLSDKRFSVDGTPTDCVVMALEELMGEENQICFYPVSTMAQT